MSDQEQSQQPHDKVAARAYELYQQSGCQEGREQENWDQAERELSGQRDIGSEPVPPGTEDVPQRQDDATKF